MTGMGRRTAATPQGRGGEGSPIYRDAEGDILSIITGQQCGYCVATRCLFLVEENAVVCVLGHCR